MKVIKYICLLIFLMFGIIMQTEIFQNELWNCETAYWVASRCDLGYTETTDFVKDVKAVSSGHDVHVFSYHMEMRSNYSFCLNIYGDDEVIRREFGKKASVEEGVYTSLVSGITEVKFHDFDDICDVAENSPTFDNMLVYMGDDDDIHAVYEELSGKYDLTEPQFWESTEKDMMIVVWGLIAILMIVMNIVSAIRRKKEVVVRASLGESVTRIVLKSALTDAGFDVLAFILARLLLSRIVSGWYEDRLVILIFGIGIVLSVLPYLSFYSFDIRQAFANADRQRGSIVLLYALKFIACALTLFTLCTNFSSIQSNLLSDGSMLKPYFDANYFFIRDDGDFERQEEVLGEFFREENETIKPVICVQIFEDNRDYLFVNHEAKSMLQGLEKLADEEAGKDADVMIFIPESKNFEYDKYMSEVALKFGINTHDPANKDLEIQYVPYSGTKMLSYLSNNSMDGIKSAKNPVVIYQANDGIELNLDLAVDSAGEIIYNCDEDTLKNTASKYTGQLGNTEMVITKVADQYAYSHSFLVKLISFLSSLCIVVLILNIAIIFAISRLEFRNNALRISLMKILGYSLKDRHKALLTTITIQNIILLIGTVIMTAFSSRIDYKICFTVCAVVMAAEYIIIFSNILKTEKTNVQKSLKGGCL